MKPEDRIQTPGSGDHSEDRNENNSSQPLYESVLTGAIKKIRYQPFLFIIALGALFTGLVINASNISSPDFRFVIVVLAVLAALGILGYYIFEGWKLSVKRQNLSEGERSARTIADEKPVNPSINGEVVAKELSGDARLIGSRVTKDALKHNQGQIKGRVAIEKASGGEAIGADIGDPTPEQPPQ